MEREALYVYNANATAQDILIVTSTPGEITSVSVMPPLRVSQLGGRKTQKIDLQPDSEQRRQIAELLQLDALRKFRFRAELRPVGRTDWELIGQLGATVVQPCAITLVPVMTRIDEPVTRRFVAHMPQPQAPEAEMPEDDSLEPLGTEIDISTIALEALALAVPAFPRADGAELTESGVIRQAPEGEAPLTETRPKPFAALAALRDTLAKDAPRGREGDE